ncbi:PID-CTERM protein-sorting domain-containing protein [Fodinibius sp.]|uniref:PID-CTERM protein-sorting domain-containing protein n=1 Tax=Fodinibius sp. TaxID=1872440 RepID=UPI002ACF07D3|nr:hypothetical protein [Fodinibius sp.]MDZ7659778.1 hypothetical protein [Fodinibius sp.]
MKGSEKKIKLFLLSLIIIIGVLFVIPDYVLAQPGLPSDPEQTPIDGGLGILAALGGVYAIKKLRN